jgi:Protein of unknown function (DUF1538).
MIDESSRLVAALVETFRHILLAVESIDGGGAVDGLVQFAFKLLETCRDVLPIAATILGFQLLVIRRPIAHPKKILAGFVYVLIGIVLFLKGLDHYQNIAGDNEQIDLSSGNQAKNAERIPETHAERNRKAQAPSLDRAP